MTYITQKLWVIFKVFCVLCVECYGSEFPERECCDSAPPPPPHYHTVTSTAVTTTTTTTKAPVQKGEYESLKHTTLNCLDSKKLCDEDPSCSAILRSIPLLCGPELVACSTVTVARCQAALRTLASFNWFQPTCLCKEPSIDPVCNAFRDLLLDHPCIYVYRKENDMHPLKTIPTCEKATNICTNNSWCRQRLDDFTITCTVSNDKCSNPDREGCIKAWLRVRETPLLGCICPNVTNQECLALQALVNSNPCVGSSIFMVRAAAMTKAGVIMGSSLVRPLPLYPQQPPPLPPTSMLVQCTPTVNPSTSSVDSKPSLYVSQLQCQTNLSDDIPQTDPEESLRQIKHIVGTCQAALLSCRSHKGCKRQLEKVASKCRITYCHPNNCRAAVNELYDFLIMNNQALALHIGLCICRRTGDRSDTECVNAQGYLHPECAERSESRVISHCHRLGRDCRDDKLCRYRLEYYEQACAADTLTGRCTGQHQECIKAAIGLFGSPMHINCVCKGEDFNNPSKCLTWKRLMWGNPCVVESQLTYYLTKIGPNFEVPPSFHEKNYARPKHAIYEHIFGEIASMANAYSANGYDKNSYVNGDIIYEEKVYEESRNPASHQASDVIGVNSPIKDFNSFAHKEESISQARKLESTVPVPVTPPPSRVDRIPLFKNVESSTVPPSTWNVVYVNTFTTTAKPTSPLPEKYCKVSREWDSNKPRILEAESSIRLYKYGNKDCSEICECTKNEETYCKVLECTANIPCETSYAVYNHNAPAYQALRGECICYSGQFICMRPREEDFHLPAGLFLLLGFSHKEEALLRTVTYGGALEALPPLQTLLKTLSEERGHRCYFELYQNTSDNLVLQIFSKEISLNIRNSTFASYKYNTRRLLEERDNCKPIAERVAEMVNTKHYKFHHHIRLSLFVLAEVFDNIPNALRSSGGTKIKPTILLALFNIISYQLLFFLISKYNL